MLSFWVPTLHMVQLTLKLLGMRMQKDFQPTLLHTQGEQGYKNKVCNLGLSAGKGIIYRNALCIYLLQYQYWNI